MVPGQEYRHNYILNLTCKILALTKSGAKVEQTEILRGKPKTKIAFYSDIDFSQSKGLWRPK